MIILEYFYNENKDILIVEFSTDEDGDDFYRIVELSFKDIQFYSPTIISKYEIKEIDNDFIVDLLKEYLKENDLPDQLKL
jgi:hypothetical protein